MDSFTRAQTVYLPRKWVLQRTLAWLDQNRRMSPRDYERLCPHRRSVHLRDHDAAHGEGIGLCVGILRQSHESGFSEARDICAIQHTGMSGSYLDIQGVVAIALIHPNA